MKTISTHKSLIFDFTLFIFFGIVLWILNIVGQISFPGNNLFPFLMRSIILFITVILSYYLNKTFCKKNQLNFDIVKFKSSHIKHYLKGILIGCILIAVIWTFTYLIYPFEILKNPNSKINLITDIISYSLGNTLEELLFRGFVLLVSIRFFGKTRGVLFVSLLFGLFHLQGMGLTANSLSIVMTTFTMSLLFISVIFYTKTIWTAVILHIVGNLLLHSFGFDGTNTGVFQIKFATSLTNVFVLTLIYEIVVIAFALIIFKKEKKHISYR